MNGVNAERQNDIETLGKRVKGQRHVLFVVLVSIAAIYLLTGDAHVPDGHTFEADIVPSSFLIQEVAILPNETSYVDHMQAVLEGCADICRIDMPGEASLYHDYIEKQVNCKAILSNPAIDAVMVDPEPPVTIPTEMMDAFTYEGKVKLSFYADKLFNQRYLGKEVRVHLIKNEYEIDHARYNTKVANCSNSLLPHRPWNLNGPRKILTRWLNYAAKVNSLDHMD